MISRLVPLALALIPLGASQEPVVLEKKVPFRVRTLAPDGETELVLCGTAVRDKRIVFNFDVYAYGLYVDAVRAPEVLAPWKGKDREALAADPSFYAELARDGFAKSLRLVFLRDVDGKDVEEAFRDWLRPRIERAREQREWPDAKQHLAAFRKLFDRDEFEKGDEILLTWMPENRLFVTIEGKLHEPIESPALCWALFDVYLGEDPIEKRGKERLVARVPGLL